MTTTFQSETGRIQQMILKSPRAAFQSQSKLDTNWQALNYLGCPGFAQAESEFEQLVSTLKAADIDLHLLPSDDSLSIDSIYCRDASILTDAGAILCKMGKPARSGEPKALEKLYQEMGIPILGRIQGAGRMEGGDTAWIAPNTLAVGHGYRTNAEGIQQLKALAKGKFEVVEVPLPHFRGPSDVFHLMSILSPIEKDLFLVYSPLMVVAFRDYLLSQKIRLVEVPEEEFDSMGGNVLALGPGQCLMLKGNPLTQRRLEAAGLEVITYTGTEISAKGCGGPTCLTRPLERAI